MLRGRRLPLPQPALPVWSSKSPSALTAGLTHLASPRSFSTTPRPGFGGFDPSRIFLKLRQDLEAKKGAQREASERQAQQQQDEEEEEEEEEEEKQQRQNNRPPSRADVETGKRAPLVIFTKPNEPNEQIEQIEQSTKQSHDTEQRVLPVTPTKPNELNEQSKKHSHDDEQSTVTEPSNSPGNKKSTYQVEDIKSDLQPTDTKSPQVSSKSKDPNPVGNSPALARRIRVIQHESQYEKLKSALSGASFWADAAPKVKDEDMRQAEPKAENDLLLSASLLTPKNSADGSEKTVKSGSSAKDSRSSATANKEKPGLDFPQQFDPGATFIKFRRVLTKPSQQVQSPVEDDTGSAENAKQAPPRKREKPGTVTSSIKSIFNLLFGDDGSEKQKATPSVQPAPISVAEKTVPDVVPKPLRPAGSIYAQLFPEEAEREAQEEEAKQPEEELSPPENSIFVSLRNEVRNWIPAMQQHEIVAPQPGEYGSHSTVIIIWGVSPSLAETDFFRIIPESKHVEGWAGGLVKVIQAREPLNQTPLGRYYLMFHSQPAANAYVEKLKQLHTLSRKLLHPSGTGFSPAKGPLDDAPVDPQPFLSEEEKANVRSLTIFPPSLPLKYKVEPLTTGLIRQIAAHGDVADVAQALRSEVDAPAKVLVTVNLPSGGVPEPSQHGLTVSDVWLTLRDDGRERSAPWQLVSASKGIMPVRIQSSEAKATRFEANLVRVELELDESEAPDDVDQRESDTPTVDPFAVLLGDDNNNGGGGGNNASKGSKKKAKKKRKKEVADPNTERFNRFILTFLHRSHAKRFVRSWHKRTIHDAEKDRLVIIDAVTLL